MILVLLAEITLSGCAGSSRVRAERQRWYALEYELRHGTGAHRRTVENESFAASFALEDSVLDVTVANRGMSSIYVHYDRAMLGINERFYPAAFSQETLFPAMSLLVPRRGIVETRLAPLRMREHMRLPSFFKTTDYGNQAVRQEVLQQFGDSLTLIVPMTIDAKETEYAFTFIVTKIRSAFSQKVLATPQSAPIASSPNRPWIPLAIAGAGLAGVIYYLASKPTPQPE